MALVFFFRSQTDDGRVPNMPTHKQRNGVHSHTQSMGYGVTCVVKLFRLHTHFYNLETGLERGDDKKTRESE